MARENVIVALSGDGGDENFAGYRRYYFDRLENQLRNIIPGTMRNHLVRKIAKLYPKADWLPQMFRAKTLLTNISHDFTEGHFNSVSIFHPEMKKMLLHWDVRKKLHDYTSMEVFRNHYQNYNVITECDDLLSKIQYVDFKTYLVDDILTKVDRASMANSLEVRVPLLDHKFVEMVATIPSHLKLKGKKSKYVFKKALARLLPADIIHRRKMGFSIPVGNWLRKELREMAEETLFDKNLKSNSFFDMKYVQQLWKNHLAGIRNNTEPLWALLAFHLWAKEFLKP